MAFITPHDLAENNEDKPQHIGSESGVNHLATWLICRLFPSGSLQVISTHSEGAPQPRHGGSAARRS